MQNSEPKEKIVYKLVLTGGPCAGKTTGQTRLSTFFENLGWKVYRVPEAATLLFSGGVRFPDLTAEEAIRFQHDLLRVMMALEECYFSLAESCKQNCLVICDRGTMDASAFIVPDEWDKILKKFGWNPVDIRDNRYHHVLHVMSAANGAEAFYNVLDNITRTEGLELAREMDRRAAQAWVGHPYFDVIDNSTDFSTKLSRIIDCVCRRMGINTGDRLAQDSRKRKFLVGHLPSDSVFPLYQDFDVIHDYLLTANPKTQARLRKRGQNGNWSYTHTQRNKEVNDQVIELKRQLSHRDYVNMLAQRDDSHYTVYKLRRCFLWQNMYFQMDIYKRPCHPRCEGLILLETYTTLTGEELNKRLPPFLDIKREVTQEATFSMFYLSLKEDSKPNKFIITSNGSYGNDKLKAH